MGERCECDVCSEEHAKKTGAAEERAKIVAWLRSDADGDEGCGLVKYARNTRLLADAIEAGEHATEETRVGRDG